MKPDSTRHVPVKSLFSPDEFLAFREACHLSDTPQSRALRDLANWWSNLVKSSAAALQSECPEAAPNMGMLPALRGGARFPLRL